MKKRYVLPVLIGVLILLVSIPAYRLLSLFLIENNPNAPLPSHYANDASGLSLTRADTIITSEKPNRNKGFPVLILR